MKKLVLLLLLMLSLSFSAISQEKLKLAVWQDLKLAVPEGNHGDKPDTAKDIANESKQTYFKRL